MAPTTAPVLSRFVLGTMTFGDTVSEEVARSMLALALDRGITVVDTANGYAGGACETMLAGLLAELPASLRDTVVLASKAGMPHPDAGDSSPLSATGLRASVDGSLRRLQVDHLDLFYLHQPDRSTPLEETLGTVRDLVSEGKIGALGVSNFAAWQIAELARVADAVGAPRPVVAQQLYNLVARRVEEEYFEYAETTGLQTMVYNPLGGGLLTGRHTFESKPDGGRFGDSRLAAMYTERYWNAELFAAIEALNKVASDVGVTPVELALRWLAGQERVSSILLGGSSAAQLAANLDAVSRGPLPTEAVEACDAVGARLRGPMPAYNR
jgi:aryl-alcohol dehydrogenase-like predicted oxidoreductase